MTSSSTDPSGESGPPGEFDRLLRPLLPALFRQAYRWTGAQDRAEDLVQDLLLRLYPRLDELTTLERVEPWAIRVMYRIFVDQYRRATNSPVRAMHEFERGDELGDDPIERFADESPQPDEQVERELLGDRLAVAWNVLGEAHRVVVALHDIEGYRLEEISSMLEVPVGTLKSRLHRARAQLRGLLAMEVTEVTEVTEVMELQEDVDAMEPFAGASRVSEKRGTL